MNEQMQVLMRLHLAVRGRAQLSSNDTVVRFGDAMAHPNDMVVRLSDTVVRFGDKVVHSGASDVPDVPDDSDDPGDATSPDVPDESDDPDDPE